MMHVKATIVYTMMAAASAAPGLHLTAQYDISRGRRTRKLLACTHIVLPHSLSLGCPRNHVHALNPGIRH